MASMQIEVASSSTPFSYSRRDRNHSTNITGYMTQCIRKNKAHDDDENSSWLPTHNSKIDDSWLPTVTSKSDASHHPKGQTDVDDSWLPTNNDTKGKGWTNTSQPENDIDYSWLPATFVEKKDKKQKDANIKDKNKNKTNTKTKNNDDSKSKSKSNTNANTITNTNNNSNSNNETQKKSKNNHWALAREVVLSSDQQFHNAEQQDSSSKSRGTVESPSSAGVSTLLRRWSAFAEAKNSNKNDNLSPPSNRNNLGSTCKENKNNIPSSSPSKDGYGESKSTSQSPPSATKDSDWESDNTSRSRRLSCPLPSRDSKDSNASEAEKEKIRVVDIIKKLSKDEELAASQAGGNGNESLPRIRTSLDNKQIEGEQKGFKGVKVSRHLIRGRQAFDNFLMLTEHNKDRELKSLMERKAVSKFSHRGRLNALLRFKSMRLEAEPKPKLEVKRHRRCVSKTLEPDNRVAIMDLRERFDSGSSKGEVKSRKHRKNVIMNTHNEEQYGTPTGGKELDVMTKTKTKTTTSINNTTKKQEPRAKPEPMTPNQSTQYSSTSSKYVVQTAKNVNSSSNSMRKYEFQEDEGQFMSAKTSYTTIEDRGLSDSEETIDTGKKQPENYEDWMTNEYSQTRSDLDENESYDMQLFETNYDWISDISRPKSDWEVMRQARYQEMLEHSSGNVDIRRLLERKTVSSFLSSSLRDLIDHVMMSRIQQSHVQVAKQEVVVTEKGVSRKEVVEQEYGAVVDEDGDYRSRTRQYNEYSEYVDRTPYSERSWRPNDGVYSSETTTTTTTTSPSLDRSLSSNRSQNNSSTPQSSPAVIHPSVEMELIYDLRGHMEQLHQEIMDLRRSIKGCVTMQVKMQLSFKQNVAAAAATNSGQKNEPKPPGIGKTCSICGDMQVNSLLYRCGHMCTCFKCAVELQRISGECPVCEAPIVDVVMAFVHEN